MEVKSVILLIDRIHKFVVRLALWGTRVLQRLAIRIPLLRQRFSILISSKRRGIVVVGGHLKLQCCQLSHPMASYTHTIRVQVAVSKQMSAAYKTKNTLHIFVT